MFTEAVNKKEMKQARIRREIEMRSEGWRQKQARSCMDEGASLVHSGMIHQFGQSLSSFMIQGAHDIALSWQAMFAVIQFSAPVH